MAPTEEARGSLERFEGSWITQELLNVLTEEGGMVPLQWPLTLQHRYRGLSTDPGGGWILVQVVTSRVIAGSALIGPSVVQRETRDAQHAHGVGAVRRVDGYSPLTGAVPQLPEGIGSVDLWVPPLDFWGGVSHHVTVQLKGVARELSLRERWFNKARWWWRRWGSVSRDKAKRKENRWKGKRITGWIKWEPEKERQTEKR